MARRARAALRHAFVASLCLFTSAAQAQSWVAASQPGGYGVAKIELAGGAVRGMALTCEKGVPILALRLAQAPRRNPAPLTLSGPDARASFQLLRNGNSDIWFTALRDRPVMDLLAGGTGTVAVAIDGSNAASIPLTGSGQAFRAALGACYAAPTQTAARSQPGPANPPAASGPGLSTADAAAISRAVTSVYQSLDNDRIKPAYTAHYAALSKRCGDTQTMVSEKLHDDDSFGACGEDASPICQCQDMDSKVILKTLRVTAVPVAPGVARAAARFLLFAPQPGSPAEPTIVHWRVVRTAAGWQLDDIEGPDDKGRFSSVDRAVMEEGIAEMRKRHKLAPVPHEPMTQPTE